MNALLKEKYEKIQQDILQKKVDDMIGDWQHKINISTNTINLAVLHEQFGWGHDRLMKFIEKTEEYQKTMANRYGKDCDALAMRRRLKEECDIDVEEIVKKMEEDEQRGATEIEIGA